MTTAIEFQGVEKRYGTTLALENITLEVPKGELVVLIGPSGCGKSTLLRLVNRMIEPSGGKLLVEGQNVLEADAVRLRRSIGYVIQSIGLFPHMTIFENVEVVPSLLNWDKLKKRSRAAELLNMVGLEPEKFGSRYPKQLSGGQQQRVGIARALAADPQILLMDEPFGAVDPITRERLQEEFLRIQREIQKTILFVTHDIDEAVKLADRICLMRDGKVEQYATPENLLAYPSSDFVRDFVGADRELKRLGRVSVASLMRPVERSDIKFQTSETASVLGTLSARDALSRLLEAGGELPVLDAQGGIIGTISLNDLTVANMDYRQRKS